MTVARLLRRALLLAILSAALSAHPAAAGPLELEAIVADRAAAHQVSPTWLIATTNCETGGTWDATLIDQQGERGPFQLHPRGELIRFYQRGYSDPENWWEASDFAAARFSEGGAGAWSCA